MNQFSLTRILLDESITALILRFDRELHISIYGGHRPHIGAVTIGDQDGCRTTQFPGHKEGVISEQWCRRLLQLGFGPVIVEAGIHYDALDPTGIQAVLDCTADMLLEVTQALNAANEV